MTSSASSPTRVDVRFQPSLKALRIAFAVHLLCGSLLIFTDSRPIPVLLFALALGLSWMSLRRHRALGFGGRALVRLCILEDGSWWAERADGQADTVTVLPDSVVTAWLVVLRLRWAGGGSIARLLLGDEADADSLRRLRQALISARGGN